MLSSAGEAEPKTDPRARALRTHCQEWGRGRGSPASARPPGQLQGITCRTGEGLGGGHRLLGVSSAHSTRRTQAGALAASACSSWGWRAGQESSTLWGVVVKGREAPRPAPAPPPPPPNLRTSLSGTLLILLNFFFFLV